MQVIKSEKPVTVLKERIKTNKFFYLLFAFLLGGIILGASFLGKLPGNITSSLTMIVDGFLDFRKSSDYFRLFAFSFIGSAIYHILIFSSAFGLIGIPVIPSVMFLRGFCTAIVSASLYRNYALYGIAFADLILLPSVLTVDVSLLILGSYGMKLSVCILNVFDPIYSGSAEYSSASRLYLKRSAVVLAVILVSSAVDAAFTLGFIRFFNF